LAALESLGHAVEPDPKQERLELERLAEDRAARTLSTTMSAEHIALVNAVRGWDPDGQECEPLTDPGPVHLARIVDELIGLVRAPWWPTWGRRLALPAVVAEVYLAYPGTAWADAHCTGCGLIVPWRPHGPREGYGMGSGPRFFNDCRGCGGALRGPGKSV